MQKVGEGFHGVESARHLVWSARVGDPRSTCPRGADMSVRSPPRAGLVESGSGSTKRDQGDQGAQSAQKWTIEGRITTEN